MGIIVAIGGYHKESVQAQWFLKKAACAALGSIGQVGLGGKKGSGKLKLSSENPNLKTYARA